MARRVISEMKAVERLEVTCDMCGCPDVKRFRKCDVCDRDLCVGCDLQLYADPIDGSDYKIAVDFCRSCRRTAAPYADTVAKARAEYDMIESTAREQWRTACRKAAGVPDA